MAEIVPVTVVGVADDRFEVLWPEARRALVGAQAVVGSRRHLALWRSWPQTARSTADTLEIGSDVGAAAAAIRRWADLGRSVCVLSAGDPGFFGVVRALLGAVDRRALRVLPGPSPVSVAFARLGLPWEDAVVVSTRIRPLAEAVTVARTARKAAVLTSPGTPPEALGAALVEAGTSMDLVAVCERLGSPDESVRELSLSHLAAGQFDPRAVVVLVGPGGLPLVGWAPGPGTMPAGATGRTEVHAVVLSRLALPSSGVVWAVGAESGSVAVEAAVLRPGLTVLAVADQPEACARISADAVSRRAAVHVVPGQVPEALSSLPAPDRAFVGAEAPGVLDAVLERLRPGGRAVAVFTTLDRATGAADRLGNLAQLSVCRGERGADGGWRLAGQDPVFVTWGPG